MSRATASAAGAQAPGWRQDARLALQFGLLWSIATGAMESLAVAPLTAGSLFEFSVPVTIYWAWRFIPLAWLVLWLERRYSGWRLFGVALPLATLVLAAWMESLETLVPPARRLAPLLPGLQNSATLCHDIWGMLFYGGLLLAGCVVGRRATRMRRLLHQAEIDRGLTDVLVAEIRLKELQGSVNTEVLYDALAAVLRRYEAGSSAADQLLDGLVGFLRTAMPSLRGETSTLAAELAVVRSYVRLRAELYPERGAWRIEAAPELGALAFPPLQLVDVIDRWTATEAGRTGGVMRITPHGGGARVELHADAPPSGPTPPCTTFDFFNPAALPVAI